MIGATHSRHASLMTAALVAAVLALAAPAHAQPPPAPPQPREVSGSVAWRATAESSTAVALGVLAALSLVWELSRGASRRDSRERA